MIANRNQKAKDPLRLFDGMMKIAVGAVLLGIILLLWLPPVFGPPAMGPGLALVVNGGLAVITSLVWHYKNRRPAKTR